jgi:hypothetical protein
MSDPIDLQSHLADAIFELERACDLYDVRHIIRDVLADCLRPALAEVKRANGIPVLDQERP